MPEPFLLPGHPVSTHTVEDRSNAAVSQRGVVRAFYLNRTGKPRSFGRVWGRTVTGVPHVTLKSKQGERMGIYQSGDTINVRVGEHWISLSRAQTQALHNHMVAFLETGSLKV